jgi:hypothetical protein
VVSRASGDRSGGSGRGRVASIALILVAVGLVFASGFAIAALTTNNVRETSRTAGTSIMGLRPTGVGLPLVGVHGTVGAGEYTSALRDYHDSGQYEADLKAVARRARAFLRRRSRALREAAERRCNRAKRTSAGRTEACVEPKLALVLDIDETSLSNYEELSATGFDQAVAALVLAAAEANSPAIGPTKKLFDLALRKEIAVFFITGRPESIPQARERTETNLEAAGYADYEQLILNDTDLDTIPYKSGARAEIEERGYDIVANVGDQESDLVGGHADRAFKLPNPFYFIG